MTPARLDLTVTKGIDFGPVCITFKDNDSVVVDITGYVPQAIVRERPQNPIILDLVPEVADYPEVGVVNIPIIDHVKSMSLRAGAFTWDLALLQPDGAFPGGYRRLGPFLTGKFYIREIESQP